MWKEIKKDDNELKLLYPNLADMNSFESFPRIKSKIEDTQMCAYNPGFRDL